MTLRIIGSGFGRTGTLTMKEALGQLGFGPTHHMEDAFATPEQVPLWQAAIAGETVDWADAFAGFSSQVDWPGAFFWLELVTTFPDARVIHTTRPAEAWWTSFDGTIGKLLEVYPTLPLPTPVAEMIGVVKVGFGTRYDGADYRDRESAMGAFQANEARVRETIPADRLLVYDVSEGWAPLCRFLGVEAPDRSYPHTHLRESFWDRFGGEPA